MTVNVHVSIARAVYVEQSIGLTEIEVVDLRIISFSNWFDRSEIGCESFVFDVFVWKTVNLTAINAFAFG